eukprot:6465838-Amphidinium_carterae.1
MVQKPSPGIALKLFLRLSGLRAAQRHMSWLSGGWLPSSRTLGHLGTKSIKKRTSKKLTDHRGLLHTSSRMAYLDDSPVQLIGTPHQVASKEDTAIKSWSNGEVEEFKAVVGTGSEDIKVDEWTYEEYGKSLLEAAEPSKETPVKKKAKVAKKPKNPELQVVPEENQ